MVTLTVCAAEGLAIFMRYWTSHQCSKAIGCCAITVTVPVDFTDTVLMIKSCRKARRYTPISRPWETGGGFLLTNFLPGDAAISGRGTRRGSANKAERVRCVQQLRVGDDESVQQVCAQGQLEGTARCDERREDHGAAADG